MERCPVGACRGERARVRHEGAAGDQGGEQCLLRRREEEPALHLRHDQPVRRANTCERGAADIAVIKDTLEHHHDELDVVSDLSMRATGEQITWASMQSAQQLADRIEALERDRSWTPEPLRLADARARGPRPKVAVIRHDGPVVCAPVATAGLDVDDWPVTRELHRGRNCRLSKASSAITASTMGPLCFFLSITRQS